MQLKNAEHAVVPLSIQSISIQSVNYRRFKFAVKANCGVLESESVSEMTAALIEVRRRQQQMQMGQPSYSHGHRLYDACKFKMSGSRSQMNGQQWQNRTGYRHIYICRTRQYEMATTSIVSTRTSAAVPRRA